MSILNTKNYSLTATFNYEEKERTEFFQITGNSKDEVRKILAQHIINQYSGITHFVIKNITKIEEE